ncbi:MAG: hypothetical protein FWD18_05800 [Micrococcales bacterium]|nr:hypothetical protein [Micrococcales bacterium]
MRSSFVRRTVTLGAVVAISVTSLTACTDTDQGGTGAAGSGPSATAGVHQVDLGAPLVSQEVPVPGSEGDTVTVGVLSLEVRGKLMILHMVFTPDFSSVAKGKEISLATMLGGRSLRAELVDTENLKVYSVVGSAATNAYSTKTVSGTPMYVWATFAAPENDNELFDVRVDDAWPVFTSIPVER